MTNPVIVERDSGGGMGMGVMLGILMAVVLAIGIAVFAGGRMLGSGASTTTTNNTPSITVPAPANNTPNVNITTPAITVPDNITITTPPQPAPKP